MRRVERIARDYVGGLSTRRFLLHPLVLTVIAAVIIGATSGEILAKAKTGDQVVIGNTGGTLSGVIQVEGALVVVGGGNSRNDLADLVGRSTLPWRRHIDLLIIPGWDDQQPIGALGLVERGNVAEIVIAGQPSGNATWDALQQAAAREAIPVSVASGHNIVKLATDVQLNLLADEPTARATAEYAIISLHYHHSMLSFIDASKDGILSMNSNNVFSERSHVIAAMRPIEKVPIQTDVLLQPRASTASGLFALQAAYIGEIRAGQHITIRLTRNELRLPLDVVSKNFVSSPAATQ